MTKRTVRACAAIVAAVALVLVSSSCRLAEYALGIRNGCIEWTHAVDFDTSAEILRGTWVGTAFDHPQEGVDSDLAVDLVAAFVDARTYTVAGTFTLGADEPLAFDGMVDGRCSERYIVGAASGDVASHDAGAGPTLASVPPAADLTAEVRDAGGDLVWTAVASWGGVNSGRPLLSAGVLDFAIRSEVDLGAGSPSQWFVELSRTGSP